VTDSVNYSALVEQAEKAVQAVKDPELKRIAFQKVLDSLLGGYESAATTRTVGEVSRSPRRKVKGSKGGATRSPRGGPAAYVRELIEDGFFAKQKTITDVKIELENRGHHIPLTSLSGPLQKLCQSKELRRQKADGRTFSYSNW
jgi:hypothetical protein